MIASIANIHTAKQILKSENIIRFEASQTLSQALPALSSSHDAIFVFDKDHFLGVASPYYLFSNRSVNTNSKLKSVAKMPPKLTLETGLSKIAQAMIQSKIHYLPVINPDTNEFLGIVTINRLLDYVVANKLLNHHGTIIFSKDTLATISDEATIAQVLAQMKKEKITKLPVVNSQNKLVGIISEYDLRPYLEKEQSAGKRDRSGEKKGIRDNKVKDYMKKMVVSISRLPTFSQAVALMNEHNIGSLIVVDKKQTPMTIITKRDLLATIAAASI
ncbi:CBS domain-containing protein [Candidatus Beckwithbacteria bacterium]|nr:CBS domain-containing protein [Candidatus Beckwithbacteria bacterium]